MVGPVKRPVRKITPKTLENMRYRAAELKLTPSQLKNLKELQDRYTKASKAFWKINTATNEGLQRAIKAADRIKKICTEYDKLRIKYGLRTIEQEERDIIRKGDRLYFKILKDIK